MRFIVDAQLPPQLAAWLRARGHAAFALRDIGLRDAGDTDVW
jgi:predicted nuclease of predicted toxin-antitoxin system